MEKSYITTLQGKVSAWQSATLLPINFKSLQPVQPIPARAEELVKPVVVVLV